MKFNHIIISLLALFFVSISFGQEKVMLLINKRPAGEVKVNSNVRIVKVQQKKFGIVHDVTLKVEPAYMDRAGYKRTLEVTDEKDQPIFDVKERPKEMTPGLYSFNIEKTRKAFTEYKNLKVYYVETPEIAKNGEKPSRKLLLNINIE
jgi:hypothetical protein